MATADTIQIQLPEYNKKEKGKKKIDPKSLRRTTSRNQDIIAYRTLSITVSEHQNDKKKKSKLQKEKINDQRLTEGKICKNLV